MREMVAMRCSRIPAALIASALLLSLLTPSPATAGEATTTTIAPISATTLPLAAPAPMAHAVDVMWFGVGGVSQPSLATIDGVLARMSDYWVSQSGGVISSIARSVKFGANVAKDDLCNMGELRRRAAAAFGHSDPSWYTGNRARHLVVLGPSISGHSCSGMSFGTQGTSLRTGGHIFALVDPTSHIDWDHALYNAFGRNLGLGNSAARSCTPPRIDAAFSAATWGPTAGCVDYESNDSYDVMSGSGTLYGPDGKVLLSDNRNIPALNVTHKVELGFLRPGAGLEQIAFDGAVRTATLAPASATSGVRGLEVIDPTTGERLYVEYRSGTGRDAASFYARAHEFRGDDTLMPGVRVLRRVTCAPCAATQPKYSTVLQRILEPDASNSRERQWLGVGHSITSYTKGVKITVVEMSNTAAKVRIEDELPDLTLLSAPTVAGVSRYGAKVSAAGAGLAAWSPRPDSVSYQWLRNGTPIAGASGSTYQIDGVDIRARISVRMTAKKAGFSTGSAVAPEVTATGPTSTRVAGASRYETAVAVSRNAYPAKAPVVYLATGADFPDALAAAPAAAAANGPLLLVPSAGAVPKAVLNRIAELAPSRIVVVGGPGVMPAAIVAQVEQAVPSAKVTRLHGANRYETGRVVVDAAFPSTVDQVFIATGRAYPDALTAAAVAGRRGVPVILLDGAKGKADAATLALLTRLSPSKVIIVGGPGAVSTGIESQLRSGYVTERLSGVSRYETSVAINRATASDAEGTLHYLATGTDFADALSGAVLAAVQRAPLSLVQPTCVPAPAAAMLGEQGPTSVVLIGGPGALGAGVAGLTGCG